MKRPSLLVVDEIGYMPVTAGGTNLFSQLVNARYERASTMFTSNKFKEWGEVFGDQVAASAILDRVLRHCHIVNIKGNFVRTAPLSRSVPAPGTDLVATPRQTEISGGQVGGYRGLTAQLMV